MALIRPIPIADFLDTAMSTTQNRGHSTSPPGSGQRLYTALTLTQVSTGRPFVSIVQAASSSGYTGAVTEVTFALTTAIGSTWQMYASPSTDRPWRRLGVTLSTVVTTSTEGSWKGLAWVGFR